MAGDGACEEPRLHPLDRRLELQLRRARRGDGNRDIGSGRQSDPAQSVQRSQIAAREGAWLRLVHEAYSPLGTGRHLSNATVQAIAARVGRSPSQVLIEWGVQHNFVVLAKSTHRAHLAENLQALDFTLSEAEVEDSTVLIKDRVLVKRSSPAGGETRGLYCGQKVSSPSLGVETTTASRSRVDATWLRQGMNGGADE